MDDADCWVYRMLVGKSDDWMTDDAGLGLYAVVLLLR